MSRDIKYLTIYDDIKSAIQNMDYKIDDKIESENELSKKYKLSRTTVKKAIKLVEKDGYIVTKKGYGSIVVSNKPRRKTILLVVSDIYSYIYKDMISAIETYLRANNCITVVSLSYRDFSIQSENLKNLVDRADGIILDPTQTLNVKLYQNEEVYSKLLDIPTILLSAKIEGLELPYIKIDDFHATQKLTKSLVTQGKKKFLLIVNTIEKQGLDRQLGILEVLNKHKIAYEIIESTRENEDFIHEEVYNWVKNYLPDVVMFYNDALVINYLIYMNELSQEIDYTITGFDNINLPFVENIEFYSPVHPKGKMGEKAAQMLLDVIEGKTTKSYTYDV